MNKWLWKSDKGNVYVHSDDAIEIALKLLSPEDAQAMREYMAFRKARAKKEVTDLESADGEVK